ncbi:MAG: transposase family protein [Anaerolineae bacterium]|nr:transposase family protein [Anaerolineae bacterium]
MCTYENVKDNLKLFRALTSLDPAEFEKLLIAFQAAWDEYVERQYSENKERQRKPGGGRKPILDTTENKLLFILFYFKTYPLQEVIAFMFGMAQSQACEWIHTLSTVLEMALDRMQHLPERDPEQVKATLAEDPENEFAIDGTERRRQRPKDSIEQEKYYSGKKKTHTVKNNVIVTIKGRKVKYLSGTCGGKKHDKKICDEEQHAFPKGSTLYQDTGFQGYAPEGVTIQQPRKKPRSRELSTGEKKQNALISNVRIVVEHVIAGIKRCRIVKDVFRNTKEGFDDLVMEIACGLHNFRTVCRAPT